MRAQKPAQKPRPRPTILLTRDAELDATRQRVRAALARAERPDSKAIRIARATRQALQTYSEKALDALSQDPSATTPPDYAQGA